MTTPTPTSSTGAAPWPEPGAVVSWFAGQRNQDLSEGRGPMVEVCTHAENPLVCHEAILHQGVQGHGDGEVIKVTMRVREDGTVLREVQTLYGDNWDAQARRHVWRWQGEYAQFNDGAGDQRGRHVATA